MSGDFKAASAGSKSASGTKQSSDQLRLLTPKRELAFISGAEALVRARRESADRLRFIASSSPDDPTSAIVRS